MTTHEGKSKTPASNQIKSNRIKPKREKKIRDWSQLITIKKKKKNAFSRAPNATLTFGVKTHLSYTATPTSTPVASLLVPLFVCSYYGVSSRLWIWAVGPFCSLSFFFFPYSAKTRYRDTYQGTRYQDTYTTARYQDTYHGTYHSTYHGTTSLHHSRRDH